MAYLIECLRKNSETGKKERYFRLGMRNDGKQSTISLGFISRKEAEALLRAHEGAAALPAGPPEKTEKPSCGDLEQLLEGRLVPYLEARGRAASTIRSVRVSKVQLNKFFGDMPIDRIRSADVDAYIASRRKDAVRTRTIQIELGHLRQSLTLARHDGLITAIPKIQPPERTDKKPHVFHTPAQSAALLGSLPWEAEPASALAIYAALELGPRSGEILSRRWEDVRWRQGKHGSLWIGPRINDVGELEWTTKTKRGRTIPLTEGFHDALRQWWYRCGQPDDGWIFRSSKSPGAPLTSYKKALASACVRAKIPKIHPHALRHSWATRMAMTGVPRAVTMALGGWTTTVVLETIYQHSVTELEAVAMEGASVARPASQPRKGLLLKLATHPK